MSNFCIKCGGVDIAVRYVGEGVCIDRYSRSAVESEFISADRRGFYYFLKSKKEHLRKICNKCAYAWRENTADNK